VFLLLMMRTGFGQITSIGGELRYQHQYQDVVGERAMATSLRKSPQFSLSANGNLVAPELAAFSLRTSFLADYTSSRVGGNSYATRQYLWDYYDLNLYFLQYAPVKFDIMARENILKSRSENGSENIFSSGIRRQEQRISVSTYKIPELPSMTAGFERTRSWSILQEPFDQVAERYSMGVSAANGSSTLNLGGSYNDIREKYSGFRSKYTSIQFVGTKDFSDVNRFDLTADYDRYDDYSSVNGTGTFSGELSDRVKLFSSIFGRNASSPFVASFIVGGSGGIQFIQDEHWRYNAAVNFKTGRETRTVKGEFLTEHPTDWAGNASVQHARSLGFGSISNGVHLSYSVQRIREGRRTLSGGLSNGIQTGLGAFSLSANHGISTGYVTDGTTTRYQTSNTADVALNGRIGGRVQSQTSANFNDDRYSGDVGFYRDHRMLQARQGLNASFVSIIPFSLSASGSVTWYFAGLSGRLYGWTVAFTSGSFFLQGLNFDYRYSRTFDPYFRLEIVEHQMQLRYQWRALTFEVRMRQHQLQDRRRDFWFSVARPFSL
jgi:hypothetical protein